jgi:hypothetical protein
MRPALRPLCIALSLAALLMLCLELRLAQLDYQPSIVDTPERWIEQRMRASKLGDKALIVIGASRIQLGLDMNTLRQETGLEPVQLSVLGSSPVTVLAGLAADPTITGTILVDYYDGFAMADTALRYQQAYERKLAINPLLTIGDNAEVRLTELARDNLRSYAGGATPFSSLRLALSGKTRQLYLTTLPDRSRQADYSRVTMPAFYHRNVMRSLGISLDANTPDMENVLRQKVREITSVDNRQFLKESQGVQRMVAAIRKRGGKVIFVKMPTGGMVEEIESRQFPRNEFWVPFLQLTGAPGIWTPDWPEGFKFKTPDGSHLDFRDQIRFTQTLVRAAQLGKKTS